MRVIIAAKHLIHNTLTRIENETKQFARSRDCTAEFPCHIRCSRFKSFQLHSHNSAEFDTQTDKPTDTGVNCNPGNRATEHGFYCSRNACTVIYAIHVAYRQCADARISKGTRRRHCHTSNRARRHRCVSVWRTP